jgi:hypothetical protein
MRPTPNNAIDKYRCIHPTLGGSERGENYGYFEVPTYRQQLLRIIASDGQCGEGWEHVSVSLPDRTPTWQEMCQVKHLFWDAEETVVQFHPPKSHYVNRHDHCLHLWRKIGAKVELPPLVLV